MPKRTFLILLITIMIVVAVSAVVIPGKIEQYRSLDKQDFQTRQYEIVTKTEEDGSVSSVREAFPAQRTEGFLRW